MKKFFLTLDLEEWYHLEYVKQYAAKISLNQSFADKVIPFLKLMAKEDVYLTVFVLGEVAKKYPDLIREIAYLGHEIACHGFNHELVYNLSEEEFKLRIGRAKQVIDEIIGYPIQGYRAPCFSMEMDKLNILWDLGFIYDASLIRFKEHKLYNVMDMSKYKKEESLIYESGGKYEFETPTLNILGKSIPISGGGYFRLFPLPLMKYFMKQHWKNDDNFVFYIHPFEIVEDRLENGIKMGKKNYFRFQVGRNNLSNKLYNFIKWIKSQDVKFMKFSDYIVKNNKEGLI